MTRPLGKIDLRRPTARRAPRHGTGDDLGVRVSADAGQTWGAMSLVNDDRTDPTSGYHGFAAADVLPDGRPMVAWIDGRMSAGLEDEPALAEIYASTTSNGGATWSADTWVAGDVCACCRIALRSAQRADGAIDVAIAYRGATNDLRDPRVVVSHDGARRFVLDTLIAVDRWKLPACPSVGPSLTLENGGGQYLWFTGESPADSLLPGRPVPGVYLVPWRADVGATGLKRELADSLADASHPMLAGLGRGTLVGALGETPDASSRKVLALRRLEPDGSLTRWLFLGSGVKSGAIAAFGARGAWAAWCEPGDGQTRVRVARLRRCPGTTAPTWSESRPRCTRTRRFSRAAATRIRPSCCAPAVRPPMCRRRWRRWTWRYGTAPVASPESPSRPS